MVIARSLLLALVTAVICLILAYPVAYCLAVRVKRFKNLFLFFLILPFWTSLMVQVYSWFFILEHNGLINSTLMKLGIITQPIHLLNTSVCSLFGDGLLLFALYDYAFIYSIRKN